MLGQAHHFEVTRPALEVRRFRFGTKNRIDVRQRGCLLAQFPGILVLERFADRVAP